MNFKIVVQSRLSSTRLSMKAIKKFYGDKSLIQVIIENLLLEFNRSDVLLATSTNKENNILCNIISHYDIECFRGSEEDVLSRFISVSELYNLDYIVRICGDNPFIQNKLIKESIRNIEQDTDYQAFFFSDGTPAILSHSGFFPELVSSRALKKIKELSDDTLDKEHVTRFIYNNQNLFNIQKIKINNEELIKGIRLTIDTAQDFEMCSNIFTKCGYSASIEKILESICPNNLIEMQQLILKNKK
jgi:spore coat polysaccharide biosynthesis protein SpsF (cytidylyltransferase family)